MFTVNLATLAAKIVVKMRLKIIICGIMSFVLTACGNDSTAIPEKGKGQLSPDDPTFHYQTLTAGPLRMDVDPKVGARIASFTYEGKEILKTERDENNWQWGSTVWTSPQSHWNWPPPMFDTAEYEFSQTGENRMHFYSPVDKETGMQVIKSIRLAVDEARGPLATLRYQVYNRGSAPVEVAVWENTRLPFSGTTSYPAGGEVSFSDDELIVTTRETDGAVVLDLDASTQPNKQKIYYSPAKDTGKRYIYNAYVNDGLALLKSWRLPANVAPEQAPLEIYLAPEEGFAELEVQGNYKTVAPGKFVDLVVFWQLFPAEELERRVAALR
ncbi:hypothetical protein CEQ90_07910 [Lewinellaceae bacterium SD302]|nr:hypothetical protein CEQ90_07910 [Lewinellaceae bacterium SD302]